MQLLQLTIDLVKIGLGLLLLYILGVLMFDGAVLKWFLNLNWELFIKFIGIVISWPMVVLALGIFILRYYKSSIENLLSRFERATLPGGARIQLASCQIDQPNPKPIDTVPNLTGGKQPESKEEWIAWIKQNPEQAYEVHETMTIMLGHERVMNLIYGTQIKLLECLQGNSCGIEYAIAQGFYYQHLQMSPGSNYPENSYFGFLLEAELISRDQTKVYITQRGISFLAYIRPIYPHYVFKSY